MLSHSGDAMLEYYRYLNSGYRLPLVGGTDKMSSAVPVGLYRTYARLDEEFSYEAWCRAVRSGRTFLSGGPLVTLSADGCEPGGTVELSGPGTVSVRAAVRSIFPLHSLEVVCNGEVLARAEANGGRQAEISEELRELVDSVSDLLSDPQLSRVRGTGLGVWFPSGRVAWAFKWKPAPSAAPRARWGHLAGVKQVVLTRWSRLAARGSGGRAGVACPSRRWPPRPCGHGGEGAVRRLGARRAVLLRGVGPVFDRSRPET
jgi:hypothetical protein